MMSVTENLKNLMDQINIKDKISSVTDNENDKAFKEDLVLFVSFDIVNSTKFKSYNYDKWFSIISLIIKHLREQIHQTVHQDFQVWRSIGDEIVFNINIKNSNKLEEIITKIYKMLIKICNGLKSGDIFVNDLKKGEIDETVELSLLSLKATSWLSLVTDMKKGNLGKEYEKKKKKIYAVKLMYENDYKSANIPGQNIIEFQGTDIDCGFRISTKFARSRKLSLSIELAYILSLQSSSRHKINLFGYKKLKGVWDNNPYPIIYYHDDYISGCKFDESFSYSDLLMDEDLKIYFENKKEAFNQINLETIIEDRCLRKKIERINKKLESMTDDKATSEIEKPVKKVEVYISAICFNKDTNKIFLAKRKCTNSKEDKWDLGCIKLFNLSDDRNIYNILESEYQKYFGINIKVEKIFNQYYLKKSYNLENSLGIRYKAITSDDNVKMGSTTKYSECKFVDKEEFEDIIKNNEVINVEEYEEIKNGIWNLEATT